jgi:outer membrane murein-binding lipoprotein Lpp
VAGKMIAGLQVGLSLDSAEFKKGADEAKKKVGELGQTLESTSSQTKKYSSAINDASDAKKNFQYNLRNVGYQVQDFSVQVAAGTSASQALAQQLPQLLSGFGTMGVVLGAVAAVGIPVAIAAFTALNGNVKSLEDQITETTSAAEAFIAANNKAGQSLENIAESYRKDAAPALQELYDQLKAIATIELDSQVKKFTQSIINEYAPMWKMALPEIFNIFRDSPVEKLAKDLGLSKDEAGKLFQQLREFKEGKRTFEELTSFVVSLSLATKNATEEGQKLRNDLLKTFATVAEAINRKTDTEKKEESDAKRLAEREQERRKAYLEGLDQQIRKLKEGENAALLFEAAKQGGAEGVAKAKQIIAFKERDDALKQSIERRKQLEERQRQEEEAATKEFYKSQEDAAKKYIKTLERQEQIEKDASEAGERRFTQIKRQIESTRTPLEVYIDQIKEYNEWLDESEINQEQWARLTVKAYEDFNNKLKKTDDILEDIRDGFKSLGASIVDAFMSGKNAGQIFKSVLVDILKRMATKQFNQLFDMFAPNTPGLFRFAGGFLGGGASLSDLSAAGGGSNFASLAISGIMADGGPVQGNEAYVIGERGPELFIPNASGTIVPNHMLMGGGQTVNYNGPYIANMQAIDTQSAAQFLAKNKMSVWAANQSATRSIPQSR